MLRIFEKLVPKGAFNGVLKIVLAVDMLYVDVERVVVRNIECLFLTEVGRVLQKLVVEVRLLGQSTQDFLFGRVEADVLVLDLQGAVQLDFRVLLHDFISNNKAVTINIY
jgi:hypothetical protein